MGHKADALAAYERARAILRRLADAHPTVTQFQRDLANCLGHIGELKLDVGKRAEAFVEFHAELAIEQKLVAASPAVTDFQRQLESTHEDLGRLLGREGHRNEALAEFRAALAIIQKLAADNPTVVDFRSRLANCLARIGKLQQAVGRTTEAADAYRKAVAIMERLPPTPVNTYDLACFHALLFGVAGRPASGLTAAEGQTEEYQAMHFLREAVAAGYRQLAWMRNDSDLDPLRSRPGFQLLMMDLAFPAEPFARRD
jgi:tetratricopeptide (TPR) repeat protein